MGQRHESFGRGPLRLCGEGGGGVWEGGGFGGGDRGGEGLHSRWLRRHSTPTCCHRWLWLVVWLWLVWWLL